MNVDELRRHLGDLIEQEQLSGDEFAAVRRRAAQRRRNTHGRHAAIVAIVGAVALAATFVVRRGDRSEHVVLRQPTTTSEPTSMAAIPRGAEPLPAAPLSGRVDQSVVWTGKQLLVWGGQRKEPAQTLLRDGAAYSPATRTWSPIASAPLGGGRAALWSGGRMLVFGVDNSRRDAAYDPVDNRWTSIASLPNDLQIDTLSAVVWNGAPVLWSPPSRDVWTYNRAADAWFPLDVSPDIGATALSAPQTFCGCSDDPRLLSSGRFLFAVATASIAYRSVGDPTWRIAPLDPEPRASQGMASSTAGGLLVRWRPGPGMGSGTTSVFDPRTGRWQTAAAPPLHGCEGGQHALELHNAKVIAFDSCGPSALFDPATMHWSQLSLALTSGDYTAATGTGLLGWGATCCFGDGTNQTSVRGWAWNPTGTAT